MTSPEDQKGQIAGTTTAPAETEEKAVIEVAKIGAVTREVKNAIALTLLGQGKGPAKFSKVLRDNRSETLAVVEWILTSAGMKGKFSLLEDDGQNEMTAKFSPEQQSAFMTTLKARYERNEHGIPCHSSVEWSTIEAKLKANPEKLDALKRMEDSGGAPDVYKVEGEDFIFGDLTTTAPEGRRMVTYQQAVARASQMGAGCKLMSPDDFLMTRNKLGIAMNNLPEWVWLDSAHRSDLLEADKAVWGYNKGQRGVYVASQSTRSRSSNGAFLCSIRV